MCILPIVAVGFFLVEVFGVGIGYSTGDGNVQKFLWQWFLGQDYVGGLGGRFPWIRWSRAKMG